VIALSVGGDRGAGAAQDSEGQPSRGAERNEGAVSLTLDEHIFIQPAADRDYNGGAELSFSGAGTSHGLSIDPALGLLDGALGIRGTPLDPPAHVFAAGLLIFTPHNVTSILPVVGDRPYASLFFLSQGRRYVLPESSVAYDSALTVGALGLEAAEAVQKTLHRLTNNAKPEGWQHQISAGGEPTARYSLARQQLIGQHLGRGFDSVDLKWTAAASAGTVTEASVALNARWGRIASPWWAVTPEQSMYIMDPQPALPAVPAASSPELFALAGFRFKLRAYNAFLEGQFRHSDLRYSPAEVNVPLEDAWAGFELRTAWGLELRYLVRWESPELRSGIASRSFFWGSIEVAKAFGR
jgi:hypothetical protein